MHFIGFCFKPTEEAAHAVPVPRVPQFGKFAGGAVLPLQNKLFLGRGELGKGDFKGDAVLAAGFFQILLAILITRGLPGFDDATGESEAGVREGEGFINFNDAAETTASGASAEGMIEGEEGGGGFMKITLIAGAVVTIRVEMRLLGLGDKGNGHDPPAVLETGGEGFGQTGLMRAAESQTILNDGDEEVLLRRSFLERGSEGVEARRFVEAVGKAGEEGATKSLAGKKGGSLIRRSFLGKRNSKKKPSFLVGVLREEIGQDGVGCPRTNGLGAVGAGKLGEAGKDKF